MRMWKLISALVLTISMALVVPAYADNQKPGNGQVVTPARATWNTGFFQEALVRKALIELGYDVKLPKDLANSIFYRSVTYGDVDYWTNGWFPIHNSQLPKDFEKHAELIGYVVKAGDIQGYMASKRDIEKFGIKSLDDFKRPEVKKAFDSDGDGKADLIGCPAGWGCEKTIDFHMKTYGLKKHIKPIKASYEAGMASALGNYRSGKPVLFYTWAPNWTIFKMKPNKDVMWINVPKIVPREPQKTAVDRMTVSGVEGAVTDPLKAGFVVSDIRIVANKKFLQKNPAIKKFFEVFKLPLADINAQNTKMNQGEKSNKDIERHATQWIENNRDKWNSWLDEARKAAK